ncbi:hypothetical protein [Blastochloris viridis]|uniref:Uncharacterized protein n=1 Tax=Blastochloris viridis TaxID=1079 RepID=A0A0H5BBS3_BLAVI|nr:hypothetical protein [Blastochloris viridis]ALK10418.1 hypothetical protein BVIR_2653 [Blastochloris viridis]BAR99640.1 hypothetical protein BV133_2047 [Blastochloris viridis]CUU43080.1 hypothetical protein BVIRIDIS_20970 [Blastochloris viridis]
MDETDRIGWSAEAVHQLRELAHERVPVHMISLRLKRPVEAVNAKLNELGLSTALAGEEH